ncbi:MAG: Ig-like domain-containing protein [Methermicoccaceae archaeon]
MKHMLDKSIVLMLLLALIFTAFTSTLHGQQITGEKKTENLGWYYKPSYSDYSPSGMPDFSQMQDQWKVIFPGNNGVLDSTPSNDDVVSSDGLRIAPGPDCHLDTTPTGDDVAKYNFCGPVAVANCLWWFDSKYEYEPGQPGNGEDTFPLVKDYGVGDDHTSSNAPKLIEKLARKMGTCSEGTTYIKDMQSALDEWFNENGLSHMFEENTYYAPTFEFIENEIERSQDVILLLGFYDLETQDKQVDQQQTDFTLQEEIPFEPEWIWQKFFPTVNTLDAVNLTLSGSNPATITTWIYDSNWVLLGSSTMQLPATPQPTWFQFHFDASIPLTPGSTYYISLSSIDPNWFWWFWPGDPDKYDGAGTSSLGGEADFAFKTEYYPPPECVRKTGHYVTCAGVNSEEQKIAFSDPARDVANPSGEDHNDAQHVSHDVYSVSTTAEIPCSLPYKWWLPGYPSGYDYTVVEQAVVICPKPSVEIEKKVWDELNKEWVEALTVDVGGEVMFEIWVHNNGGYDLDNITVTDKLPECLSYVTGSAEPSEPAVQGNKLVWSFQGPLPYCHAITIRFNATAVSERVNVNKVNVTADTIEGNVSDDDTATVTVIQGGQPSVEVEKKASKDNGVTWEKEVNVTVGGKVRFRIMVHNNGDLDLTNILVTDVLPECLQYADNATPYEPQINNNQLTWSFDGPLPHCETITIEFDAQVVSEGENINNVSVSADTEEGSVTDSDTAVVYGVPGGPDTTPPTVVITKPKKGSIYIFDTRIIWLKPFSFTPICVGKITVEADAYDNQSGVNKVEFYLDGTLQTTDTTMPYSWTWKGVAFFKHTIKAVAYDNAGNTASDEITIWRFF